MIVDADFSGNWDPKHSDADPATAKSRSGWVIFYAGCLVLAASKLQTQVALSTTEAEYIALSTCLRDVIPLMELVDELRALGFPVICTEPYIYCKLFEDNSGALEMVRVPKQRQRTKHINCSYHHFREHVRKGLIKIFPIKTDLQPADILGKPVPQNILLPHRKVICGE